MQALSGTGALWLASQFYLKFLPKGTEVHISDPSWGNHAGILKTCAIATNTYRYLDPDPNPHPDPDPDPSPSQVRHPVQDLPLPRPRLADARLRRHDLTLSAT